MSIEEQVDNLIKKQHTMVVPKRNRQHHRLIGTGAFIVTLTLFLTILIPLFTRQEPMKATTVNFGKTTFGSTGYTLDSSLRGINVTPAGGDGWANHMKVGLYYSVAGGPWDVQCAIYDASWNMVATTESKTIALTSSATWYQFNFSTRPVITNGVKYKLCVAGLNNPAGTGQISSATSGGDYFYEAYVGWPNPLSGLTFGSRNPSIYCNYTMNTAPVFTNPAPANTSTGVTLNHKTNITINDGEGNTMTVTWWNNKTGSWVKYAQNNSASNGTFNVPETFASSYDTKYYWRVNAFDGIVNHSEWFYFETEEESVTSAWRTTQTIGPQLIHNDSIWKTTQTLTGSVHNDSVWKTTQTINGFIHNDSLWRTTQTIIGKIHNDTIEFATHLNLSGLSPTWNITWNGTIPTGSVSVNPVFCNSSGDYNETMKLLVTVNNTMRVDYIEFWAIFLNQTATKRIDCDNVTVWVSENNITWGILHDDRGSGFGRFPKGSGILVWDFDTNPVGINPFTYVAGPGGGWYILNNKTLYVRYQLNITDTAQPGTYHNQTGSDWQVSIGNDSGGFGIGDIDTKHHNCKAVLEEQPGIWQTVQTIGPQKIHNDTIAAWQTIQTITGLLHNDTVWRTMQIITGLIHNDTNWKTIQMLTGLIHNDSIWITTQTITGLIHNDTIPEVWHTTQTISGKIHNGTLVVYIIINGAGRDQSPMYLLLGSIGGLVIGMVIWRRKRRKKDV